MKDGSSFSPVMIQNWGKLLFAHWPVKPEELRPLIPADLEMDTFNGSAWIAVVPFTMWGIRHFCFPPIPGLSAFHEMNVRTYVKYRGVPAVWFFSLDATNPLAVWAARRWYQLPYYRAKISLQQNADQIHYRSERTHKKAPEALLDVRWRIGEKLPPSQPGSLAYFLTERYRLYATRERELFEAQIYHQPWPLRQAELISLRSTMVAALGLAEPTGAPLLHYAESLHVKLGALKKVQG